MRRAATWSLGAAGALAVFGASGVGHADPAPAPQPIRVEYAALPECPGAETFVAQVLARTPLARRARDDERARVFAVTIGRRDDRFVGELSVREQNGESSARTVSSAACGDLVGALALVAALSIDPEASTAPLPANPPPAAATAPAPPASAPLAATQPAPTAPPPITPLSEPLPFAPPAAPPRQNQSSWSWKTSLGLMGGVTGAVAPNLMPTARLFASFDADTDALFAPALTLSVGGGYSPTTTALADVSFTSVTARLDACPIAWRPVQHVALRPCAAFEAGRVRVAPSGGSLARTQTSTDTWLAADALAAMTWRSGALTLRLEGGLVIPVIPYDYVFVTGSGNQSVHKTPAVGGFGGLGAGVAF